MENPYRDETEGVVHQLRLENLELTNRVAQLAHDNKLLKGLPEMKKAARTVLFALSIGVLLYIGLAGMASMDGLSGPHFINYVEFKQFHPVCLTIVLCIGAMVWSKES